MGLLFDELDLSKYKESDFVINMAEIESDFTSLNPYSSHHHSHSHGHHSDESHSDSHEHNCHNFRGVIRLG